MGPAGPAEVPGAGSVSIGRTQLDRLLRVIPKPATVSMNQLRLAANIAGQDQVRRILMQPTGCIKMRCCSLCGCAFQGVICVLGVMAVGHDRSLATPQLPLHADVSDDSFPAPSPPLMLAHPCPFFSAALAVHCWRRLPAAPVPAVPILLPAHIPGGSRPRCLAG